jgi:hypothetical protein
MDNFERRVLLVLALANLVIISLVVLRRFLPRIKTIRINRNSNSPEYYNKDVTIEKIVTSRR